MFSRYGKLSTEVYDIDKPVGKSFGEIEFYMNRLEGVKGRILEPGVGSGRVLIPFLKAGYQVEGFDYSPEMLISCKERMKAHAVDTVVWEASFTSFEPRTDYEAIMIPTGTFLLLETREDTVSAMKLIYKSLKPGGRFLVDIFLQTDFEMGKVSTRTWITPDAHAITMESKMVEIDFLDQRTVTHLKYEKWKNGSLMETELQNFPLRWYGIEEFRAMLEKTGFADILIFADYSTDAKLTSQTSVFTFEANLRI